MDWLLWHHHCSFRKRFFIASFILICHAGSDKQLCFSLLSPPFFELSIQIFQQVTMIQNDYLQINLNYQNERRDPLPYDMIDQ